MLNQNNGTITGFKGECQRSGGYASVGCVVETTCKDGGICVSKSTTSCVHRLGPIGDDVLDEDRRAEIDVQALFHWQLLGGSERKSGE